MKKLWLIGAFHALPEREDCPLTQKDVLATGQRRCPWYWKEYSWCSARSNKLSDYWPWRNGRLHSGSLMKHKKIRLISVFGLSGLITTLTRPRWSTSIWDGKTAEWRSAIDRRELPPHVFILGQNWPDCIGIVIHVTDASKSVPIAGETISEETKESNINKLKETTSNSRVEHEAKQAVKQLIILRAAQLNPVAIELVNIRFPC